jgi:hypothetical protein
VLRRPSQHRLVHGADAGELALPPAFSSRSRREVFAAPKAIVALGTARRPTKAQVVDGGYR